VKGIPPFIQRRIFDDANIACFAALEQQRHICDAGAEYPPFPIYLHVYGCAHASPPVMLMDRAWPGTHVMQPLAWSARRWPCTPLEVIR